MKDLKEEIIKLLDMGFDKKLISFELDISIEEVEECNKELKTRRKLEKEDIKEDDEIKQVNYDEIIEKYKKKIQDEQKRLELRELARNSLLNRNVDEAIKKLSEFVEMSKDNDVESLMLQKLNAFNRGQEVKIKDLQDIESSKNMINIQRTINLLAFTYFKAGKIDEAKEELKNLVNEYNDYTAYRQLIHIEKTQGKMEDYELWIYELLDNFPNDIWAREQLILIAKQKGDRNEQTKLLKEILTLNPINMQARKKLEDIIR